MALNKVKGNMYPFLTHTGNPLLGECPHKCSYCSTKKFHYPELKYRYSGKIRRDVKFLESNLGNGKYIFIVSQNDLFANEVPIDIIHDILLQCDQYDNQYFIQSRNTERMMHFQKWFPKKVTTCTTIESNLYYPEIMGLGSAPPPWRRIHPLLNMITIEPILKFNLDKFVRLLTTYIPYQINIGADSGNNHLPEPSKEEVLALIAELEKFTTVYQKDNLKRILK